MKQNLGKEIDTNCCTSKEKEEIAWLKADI
jgi:hypothetical protein